MPVSGAGPACSQIAANFGGSFPCDSYGHTIAVAHPMEIYSGAYRMNGFAWSPGQDGCNAENGAINLA